MVIGVSGDSVHEYKNQPNIQETLGMGMTLGQDKSGALSESTEANDIIGQEGECVFTSLRLDCHVRGDTDLGNPVEQQQQR